MKALLVYPNCPNTFWSFKHALKFIFKEALHPPLGLLTVASMLPKEWEKRLIDMNVTSLTDKDIRWADYVLISGMAVQKESAKKVIEQCKKNDTKIIAGGPLFTADPDNFSGVDHLVLNEAENTLPQLLSDLERGEARHKYTSDEYPSLNKTPIPLWGLLKKKKYVSMNIQYSRGCPFNCDFCDITTLYGHKSRTKSKVQVISELEALYQTGWRGNVFFVDDNFIGNKIKLKTEVLPAIIKWMKKRRYPFNFSTEASIDLSDDELLMRKMAEAGFDGVFVGIETPNEESLAECNKQQNRNRNMVECIKKIHSYGLEVHGGFIVGFDSDTPSIFERQIEFIQQSRIVTAMIGLLNAPKGSKLHKRVTNEGRLVQNISGDNTDFSTNIMPKMGMEKLMNGYRNIIKGVYSPIPYYKRAKEYIREDKPLLKRKYRIHFGHIRNHFGYLGAIFSSFWLLGVKDKERYHYWKLILWTLVKRPLHLHTAITYAICGFHFRKVFEKHMDI